MINNITKATYEISEESIYDMPLVVNQLPEELSEFKLLRERALDNETMAEHGFPGNSQETFANMGRITGFLREFAAPSAIPIEEDGADIVAATVVHLFKDEESAASWMKNVFVKQFEDNVGSDVGEGQILAAVETLEIEDFYDEAVGIRAVQDGKDGILSTTVLDFRVGRLLGVSFLVTVGDYGRTEVTTKLGLELERNIVRQLLSTS
tara:strand:+ start:451 stop:1074 length:624 start_codon:yes stop_codon:yes gene_type:complete